MSIANVLVVEDEVRLLDHLAEIISAEGFNVTKCNSFEGLKLQITDLSQKPDVIVLDRLLGGKDSASLVPLIIEKCPNSKVLVLSAINSSTEKAALLDQGVEDYLAKPFEAAELTARIRVLLRRNSNELAFSNVVLDLEKRVAKVDGQEVNLQNREFLLLKTLVKIPGKIYNKKYLYEHVWEVSSDVDSNVVETTVNKLRRRMEEAGARLKLNCIRYKGYWVED